MTSTNSSNDDSINNSSTVPDTLEFYRHIDNTACGYLPNQESNSIFINPDANPTEDQLNSLHLQGFRRSGRHVYRPSCPECNQCYSSRVINTQFQPSKSQKKTLSRNKDIRLSWADAVFSEEHYQLYENYINTRHQDGEMYPASEDQYTNFLIEGHGLHKFLEARDAQGNLLACCVVDIFYDGLSAIYSYFDTDQERRSLGRYMVLGLISQGLMRDIPYTYLGYWIKESHKMNYKSDYRPLEIFNGDNWQKLIDLDNI